MKKYASLRARFGVTLTGCFMFILMAANQGVAEDKPKAESERQYLHFGNMGGLMPNLAPGDLKDAESPGAKAIIKYCSQCHNPPGPGMHTREEWNQVFWRMIWRMQIMRKEFQDFQVPTYSESHLMFTYLTDNAMVGISASDVPQMEGSKEFLKICMQCHRLPSPILHESKDWQEVVKRMKTHMKSMGRIVPTPAETDRIVSFLKSQNVKP